MNELQLFNFENNQVRTLLINDEPWFVGKDVAEILGYSKARNAIATHVDDDDKKGAPIQGDLGGTQEMTVINESGVYALVFGSKLPSAKRFKHWVTSEVLPQIRKTGSYASPQLTGEELMAKALIEANSVLARQSKQLEEQKPKVLFADSVIASKGSILVRELAKLIKQNGYDIGEKKLYRWLREKGYICKNSTEPTQMAMNLGLFEIVVRTIERGDDSPKVTRTTKVTGKGQVYFINKLCNSNCSLYDLEPLF
ncbi:MAG: phage antirepressor [Lactobacillus johnsonii]|nr:phage antirepressor [Lactobacillus johnsonii]